MNRIFINSNEISLNNCDLGGANSNTHATIVVPELGDFGVNSNVDTFFERAGKWREEMVRLRSIVLKCGLLEELKWGQPCYASEGKNILIIHAFKNYCALLFFKGALMDDPKHLLIQQTENVQLGRQIRFASVQEIDSLEPELKLYIDEGVKVEKSGKKLKLKETSEYEMCNELGEKLREDKALKSAFEKLTPGRQRQYIFYISSAKQPKTRLSRIEKYYNKILQGQGLYDE